MECTLIDESPLWQKTTLPEIEPVLQLVLRHINEADDKSVAIVLLDDTAIQAYNRDYRGKDKPTNVLSFPSDAPDEWGDLLFAFETIARESEAQGKTFQHHFTHLLVHGMLHLLGYDHEEDSEAEAMEALEIAILSELAIANPYASS